jgi:hypothetical protein
MSLQDLNEHKKNSVSLWKDINLYGKIKSIENEEKQKMVKYRIPLKNKVFNGLEQKILLSFPLTIVNYIFSFLTKYDMSLYILIIKVAYKISPFWDCKCYCKRNELFRKKVNNTYRIFYKRCLGCFCELCTYANISNGGSFNCKKVKDKCNCDKCYYGISKCYMHTYYKN